MESLETLAAMIRRLGRERADAPAVTLGERTDTFAALDDRSNRAARVLAGLGVGPGDRVAVLDKNSPSYYEVLFGAAKLGAVVVGINFRLAPPEVAAIVADAEPVAVVVGAEFAGLVPAQGPPAIVLGDDDGGPDGWEGRLVAADASDPGHEPAPDDVVLTLYSSGTTGLPKGAMLTHANLAWTPEMGRRAYGMDAATVNLVPSPLFHIGGTGYSLTTMGQGGQTVLVRDVDPAAMLGLIERHRVTHSFLVPAVVSMLVAALADADPRPDLSSLRYVAYGAAPMSERGLLEAIAAFGCGFLGVYGMTETAGSVLCLPAADHDPGGPRAGLLRSVGRTLPWHEVEVRDPATGERCPPGEVGEIWVRSPQVMAGYWRRPELTAEVLTDEGWLRSGDAAWADAEGYVFVHDRLKDMIISGGENVYPAEVERVLARHAAVGEVVVIGVPHERWGETVKALVVLREDAGAVEPDALAADLLALARTQLARYKCPTSVDVVAELPRNASGKILKRVLRAPFWATVEAGG